LAAGCDSASSPDAVSPAPLWELAGFENPESAFPDAEAGVIYVSNVAGTPTGKDGNGSISKVSLDGRMVAQKWVTGLDAPKGLALLGGKLYAADIDRLVEIDTKDGKVLARYDAAGAKFLNDVAADSAGNVYVSDMATNTIWRLSGGKLEAWLASEALLNPNGLLVQGDTLVVAAWGRMTDGFATKVPGHLLAVSLADKSVKPLGSATPVGNLDGLEPLDKDTFLVSDWMNGKVFKIARSGEAKEILSLGQGAADLGYDAASKTAFIPQMKEGRLSAYRVE
jgi:DNA-binding beta-propeller fold protein YncE